MGRNFYLSLVKPGKTFLIVKKGVYFCINGYDDPFINTLNEYKKSLEHRLH